MSQCFLIPTKSIALACKAEIINETGTSNNPLFDVNVLHDLANAMVEIAITLQLEWIPAINKNAHSSTWDIVIMRESFKRHFSDLLTERNMWDPVAIYDAYVRCRKELECIDRMYEKIHEIVWTFVQKPCWLEVSVHPRVEDIIVKMGEDHRILAYMRMRDQLSDGAKPLDVICDEFNLVKDKADVNEKFFVEENFSPVTEKTETDVSLFIIKHASFDGDVLAVKPKAKQPKFVKKIVELKDE